ncbi:MAG: cytochrome C [Burkholderiales bacterium]|nr:cytochrome C [Burkholderiales bacterium]
MKTTKAMMALLLPAAILASGATLADQATNNAAEKRAVERGRYLVKLGGCNDCHTPGYPERDGKIPEADWLTGNPVGFQGPWGTSYPANLRLVVHSMSEAQWLAHVRTPMRPPMPWYNLRDATDTDLRALYSYIRSLGVKGDPAPAAAAPGVAVKTPYVVFVPQNLPPQKQAVR